MRLIDADRLEYLLKLACVNPSNKDEGLKLARYYMKNMPTVKAIPIDFIKAFSEILLDRRERFVLETLIEVWEGKRETKVPYINQMLDDWEKENEKQTVE